MNNAVQYGGTNVPKSKKVYFRGTTALRAYQALCYDEIGVTPVKGLGIDVKVPTTASLPYFAGLVDPADAGRVGPCFISILTPEEGEYTSLEIDGTTDVAAGDTLGLQSTSSLEGFAKITPGTLTTGNTGVAAHPIFYAGAAVTANQLNLTDGNFCLKR